jgi:hypothetical protein
MRGPTLPRGASSACCRHRLLALAVTLVVGLALAPAAQAVGPAFSMSPLLLSPTSVHVGGASVTATVTVKDVTGTAVPGETVVISTNDPGIPPQVAHDPGGTGTYTATFASSGRAGPVKFTATDTGTPTVPSVQATLTQTGPGTNIALALQPPVVKADGASISTATATVTDAAGNPVSGDNVVFSSSNPGDRIIPQGSVGNVYSASILSSTQPGLSTITADDSTAGISTHQTLSEVAGSTTMNLVISPLPPVSTNQNVSLFATISSSGGSPHGTVTLWSGFFPIAGCASLPISPANTVATCQTSFPASSSPVQISAIFTADSASTVAGSSSTSTLVVGPGATSTSLDASSPTPIVGTNETYTAVVAPGNQGPVSPTGSVAFKRRGKPIHGCASVPVRSSGGALSASCTVRYATRGPRRVTAIYSGDQNFGGSSSGAILVSVQTLGVLTSTLQWIFAFTPTYTTVASLLANGVSPGTRVIVMCNGHGCPFARRVSAQSGGVRCTPTGKHRCGRGPIGIAGAFHRHRLTVGTRVIIEIRRPGWIGKFYSFLVRSGRGPRVRLSCLAPGLSKPGIGC